MGEEILYLFVKASTKSNAYCVLFQKIESIFH